MAQTSSNPAIINYTLLILIGYSESCNESNEASFFLEDEREIPRAVKRLTLFTK